MSRDRSRALLNHLLVLCQDMSKGRYGGIDDLFELTKKSGPYPSEIRELAEAFGMMYVKVEAREFHSGNLIDQLKKARAELEVARERLARENAGLKRSLGKQFWPGRIIGRSRPMQALMATVEKVADVPVNVLITGETGTGKELIARALHYNSARAGGPFIALNCAAIPEALLESELFGIEKGVATGVDRRIGRIEQAQGGTLFLDEIGDMPPACQAKVLRVLEDREVLRLGGKAAVPVDIRIVTATNRDLKQEVAEERFREDLYFRIKVVHLHIPPLRERPDDIPLLLRSFLKIAAVKLGRGPMELSPDALDILKRHLWSGNVRELENEVERVVALSSSPVILPEHLSAEIRYGAGNAPGPCAPGTDNLREAEESIVRRVLAEPGCTQTEAARRLGISREGLRKKRKRLGLDLCSQGAESTMAAGLETPVGPLEGPPGRPRP